MNLYLHKSCYFTLLAVAVFDCGAIALLDARVSPLQIASQLILVVPIICFVITVSKVRFTDALIEKVCTRASYFCQGFVFLLVSWIALRIFNHLSMRATAGIGYADDLLSQMDGVILVSWSSYFEAVKSSPGLFSLLDESYTSLTILSVVAYALISCCRDIRRAGFFMEAFFFTAVICTSIGMFFPAQGTVISQLGAGYDFSGFSSVPGVWFIESLTVLRGGKPVLLDINNLPGLVTFPSFHTAAAVVLIGSFWRTVLFLPVLLYSMVVIAATPIFGGHYFVDLLGGIVVAVLVMSVLATKQRFNGLFAARTYRVPASAVAEEAA